jgi:uncharacterized protein YxjI
MKRINGGRLKSYDLSKESLMEWKRRLSRVREVYEIKMCQGATTASSGMMFVAVVIKIRQLFQKLRRKEHK